MAVRANLRRVTREEIFVDTGAWFAYINADDPDHRRVRQFIDQYPGHLITSNYIFDETVTLTLARLGHRKSVLVGKTLLNPEVVEMIHVTPADEKVAWSLFEKRPDKAYSFTDCTSFVVMRRLKLEVAVALDNHFLQEGFQVRPG
ncbi:MAG: type II toxin-antitoxin system VapC family toxin [Candidatus Binatia bacterium]